MTFEVIDKKTGKAPTYRVIRNLANKGGLLQFDIDGFYLGEDGSLALIDDCGNTMWPDPKRFEAIPTTKPIVYISTGYADGYPVYDEAECPNCGHMYEEDCDSWNEPFCPHCGQRLDWYQRRENNE